jgi:hypothetical protein
VHFARISESGAQMGDHVVVRSGTWTSAPAVAWNGVEFGIMWIDSVGASPGQPIWFTRVSASGVKVIPERQVTREPLGTYASSFIADGARYAVAYRAGQFEGTFAGNYFLPICP